MAASGLVLKPMALDSVYCGGLSPHGGMEPVEAIQIYLATLGSDVVFPLGILSCDTIASVKLRVQAYKGFYVKQQRLVYGGRELTRDDCLIKDCGITTGEILHLVLRLSSIVDVTIQTVSGRTYILKVERTKNVRHLKQLISNKEDGLDVEDQQLILRGEHLDDQKVLNDLSLEDKSVVHLLVAKSAKVRTKCIGKHVEISVTASNLSSETFPGYDILTLVDPKLNVNPLLENGPKPLLALPHSESILGAEKPSDSIPILAPAKEVFDFPISDVLFQMLDQVKTGLLRGYKPSLAPRGTGGTYFMKDANGMKNVAIFKPVDEEPMAENNPRGLMKSLTEEGLKKGIKIGEGALREVAAYILDYPLQGPRFSNGVKNQGFSGVPGTIMIHCFHKGFNYSGLLGVAHGVKTGSLQQFVNALSDCEDMGYSNFTVEEVHKISVLDMRLANTDRNGGNILVCKDDSGLLKLVPIDHGYCFPETFEDCTFEWLYWQQAKTPYQPEVLSYIAALDVDEDIALLRKYGWDLPPKCAKVLRVATMLLKKGAAADLSPFAIGSMMCRDDINRKSKIENMIEAVEAEMMPGSSDAQFMQALSEVMDYYIDEAILNR